MKVALSLKCTDWERQLLPDEEEFGEEFSYKYLQYNEYLNIQYDTETKIATIIKQ